MYNRIRDFVTAAATELAGRDTAEIDNQIAFHTNAAGDEEYEPGARAQYKTTATQIEKKRNTDPASVLASQELPALAAIFGAKKSDVEVDAAALELMRACARPLRAETRRAARHFRDCTGVVIAKLR